jgi:hypothetical protein
MGWVANGWVAGVVDGWTARDQTPPSAAPAHPYIRKALRGIIEVHMHTVLLLQFYSDKDEIIFQHFFQI